jgi:ubiquinone/menaquinone biosynthesis C-methylase UbiE
MTNDPSKGKKERLSTYIVQDRQNREELQRLTIQDKMITERMGGILQEQDGSPSFNAILDVACGTGGWLIEAAKSYPTVEKLVGVDISSAMIEYAHERANDEQVADRVQFCVMDTLRMLEFPKSSFDLVNMRFGMSFLRTWDWAKLLAEFQRIAKYKGVIRVTDSDMIQSNSPALTHLVSALQLAFYNAGHFFRLEKDGLVSELEPLMIQHGLENVQTRVHMLTYRAGTPEGHYFSQDMEHVFRTVRPYIQKWTPVLDNYDVLYQQALEEMQQQDFEAVWRLVTVWGTRASILK